MEDKENTNNNSLSTNMLRTLKLKTLAGISSIMITSNETTTGNDIKLKLCEGTCLTSHDILLVKDGKEIKSDALVNDHLDKLNHDKDNDNDKKKADDTAVIFALLRSTSTSKADLVIKNKNENKSYNLSFQVNMKIFQLRKEISKISGIKPPALRMILGSRVLKDEGIIGDYLLSEKKRMNKQTVIQISRIIDITHDVDIKIHFPNKSILEFSMEVGVAISTARQILAQRFFMPLNVPLEIYLDKQYQNKLDYSRSLLDYGIYPIPGKKTTVDLYIKVYDGKVNNKTSLEDMLDNLINDISSSMKTKVSKAKKISESKNATLSATNVLTKITTSASTSSVSSKKPSKGGLFSSMRRGFLSKSKKNDDSIITKEDDTPIKIKKMSNVTKQVNTLLFDEQISDEN
jgi:hypothetical protein